jgi:predicted ATPase
LQLLDYLARCCRDMPLMIVGVYRSDEADRSPLAEILQRWNSYPAHTSIVLGPLAEREVRELLEIIWSQTPPADLVGAVYRRSQGNALFVEEIAKNLVDEETVSWREGRWYFAPVVEAGLPQRLRDAVLRRLNRLSKETQALLCQAAVLGYTFTFDHLRQISELSDGNILEGLDTDLERQMIRDVPTEGVIRFNHANTQEALYENLSPLKQRLIHREVGETLEQSHVPFAAELAYHFFQAQELEKGLTYGVQAAAQARALWASPTALFWYTQTLEALDGLGQAHAAQGQRFELLLAREQIYDALEDRPAQANDLAALQALAQGLGDPAKQAMVQIRQAQYERAMKQLAQAATAAQAALLTARQLDNPILEAESLIQLAYISAGQGHVELAQAHMHDAQEFLEQAGVPQAQARSLNGLGDIYRLLKDHAQAEKYYRQALALTQTSGDRPGEATSLNNLGSLLLEMGDSASAAAYCRQALEISRLIGQRQIETTCLKNLEKIEEPLAKTLQQG